MGEAAPHSCCLQRALMPRPTACSRTCKGPQCLGCHLPPLTANPLTTPHLWPESIGDTLGKVATAALGVAHHPNVLRVGAVAHAPAIGVALLQGALCAYAADVVQPDGPWEERGCSDSSTFLYQTLSSRGCIQGGQAGRWKVLLSDLGVSSPSCCSLLQAGPQTLFPKSLHWVNGQCLLHPPNLSLGSIVPGAHPLLY